MKSDQKSSRIVVSKSRVEWKFKVRAVKKVESRKVESKSRFEWKFKVRAVKKVESRKVESKSRVEKSSRKVESNYEKI